jgi:hypothetical protein
MPGIRRLRGLAALATLPETRRLLMTGARPANLRALAARARADRASLLRDAARHPATAELANAGLLLLPIRYSPIGWAAAWAIRRANRRRNPRENARGRGPARRAR